MTDTLPTRSRARWWHRFRPTPGLGKLSGIHALHSGAEALVAVSLAGSLFFSVSIDASRPRILLYLGLTLAPFAILGPLIGPFIDKVKGGHRIVLASTLVGRALLVAVLSGQIQSLWLYPIAFGVLVLGRTYSVTRNAIVPSLVPVHEELVRANATLAIVGVTGGAIASSIGVVVLNIADASWLPRLAVLPYAAAALLSLSLANTKRSDHEVDDIVEIVVDPAIRSAAGGMAGLRAAVGFLTFHVGFALKSGGEPAWFFGAVLAANGAGSIAGTLLSPWLRRRVPEYRMLTLSLAAPAAVAAVAALRFHRITVIAIAFVLGVGLAVGRRAFDSVVQTHAPHGSRGSAYAGLETRLELSWVAGALAAVVARAAGWLGLAVLAAALAAVVVLRVGFRRLHERIELLIGQEPLAHRLFLSAEEFAARGDHQQAVVMVGAALDAARLAPATRPVVDDPEHAATVDRIESLRRRALAGEVTASLDALRLMGELLDAPTTTTRGAGRSPDDSAEPTARRAS